MSLVPPMKKKVKTIVFVLENCETLSIDVTKNGYHHIFLGEVKRTFDEQCGNFSETLSTNYFYALFDSESLNAFIGDRDDSDLKVFEERLDVTAIVFVFEDGEKMCVGLPWRCDDVKKNGTNRAMKISRSRGAVRIEFDARPWPIRLRSSIRGAAMKWRNRVEKLLDR